VRLSYYTAIFSFTLGRVDVGATDFATGGRMSYLSDSRPC